MHKKNNLVIVLFIITLPFFHYLAMKNVFGEDPITLEGEVYTISL